MALALGLERRRSSRVLRNISRFGFALRIRPHTLLEFSNGGPVERRCGNVASLQGAAVKAWLVRVESLSDDLPPANDDRTVAVQKGRQLGLSEAEGEIGIIARRHFDREGVWNLVSWRSLRSLKSLRLKTRLRFGRLLFMQVLKLRIAFLDVADLLLELRRCWRLKLRFESTFASNILICGLESRDYLPYKSGFRSNTILMSLPPQLSSKHHKIRRNVVYY